MVSVDEGLENKTPCHTCEAWMSRQPLDINRPQRTIALDCFGKFETVLRVYGKLSFSLIHFLLGRLPK